jgi:hypothetical protein
MRLFTIISAILMSLFLLMNETLTASVDFVIDPNESVLGPWAFYNTDEAEAEITEPLNNAVDNNEKIIPYGLALANTLGYPNGKAIILNFEAGISAGAAVYKYDRYEDFNTEDPEVPGAGANAAVHFGMGLTENTDITFKLFIKQGMYTPDKNVTKDSDTGAYEMKLDETNLFSAGVKGRYRLIGETEFIPNIFSFSGITAGAALDFSHGRVSSTGTYMDISTITFQGSDIFSGDTTLFSQDIDVQTIVTGETALEWNILSVTPEIMAYIDLFYFFSLYTGPAVSLNAGNANFTVTSEGDMKNLDPVYRDQAETAVLINPNQTVATGKLVVNAPMKVPVAVPLWKLGLELNLGPFKIQGEAATVLTSPADSFTAQIGARVQF